MGWNRRAFIGATTLAAAGTLAAAQGHGAGDAAAGRRIRRIATEEAFSIPEIYRALAELGKSPSRNLDMILLRTMYTERRGFEKLGDRLLDLDDERIRIMDENGVDMHVLSLTAPGVQMFDTETAVSFAKLANDRLAEAIARHPARYAGLASFAPQDPKRAVKEMERAVRELGLHGFVVNSHTNNEYYDDQKYWPIFEVAEALDRAIYIHPRAPADTMAEPFRDYNMDSAMWGYGIETSTHALRLIMAGVFDRFPKLKIVLGHMGEGIPYWLWRIDYMSAAGVSLGRIKAKLKPSEYFRRNFLITTSGVEDPLVMQYCLEKLGAENIMWAIDYPYQPTEPAVKFMDSVSVPPEVREQIYHRNAERVFHIPEARA
ncbi:MAG: amidohydrolase family protein [Pseudomonadota bacterium]|jgi:Predicted metal-dependent hydrolase of the TIM-barrel fold